MWTSAVESDPPETAATTARVGADQIVLVDVLTDGGEDVHENCRPPSTFAHGASVDESRACGRRGLRAGAALPRRSSRGISASEGWCRGPDSNRRPRAYETRALTN